MPMLVILLEVIWEVVFLYTVWVGISVMCICMCLCCHAHIDVPEFKGFTHAHGHINYGCFIFGAYKLSKFDNVWSFPEVWFYILFTEFSELCTFKKDFICYHSNTTSARHVHA